MQVSMRAPNRDMIGGQAMVEGVEYKIGAQGVVAVHDVHVAGFKSLGFKLCSDEKPDAPALSAMTDAEVTLAQQAVLAARKAKADAETAALEEATKPAALSPAAPATPRK
jgi:hypothetical protein